MLRNSLKIAFGIQQEIQHARDLAGRTHAVLKNIISLSYYLDYTRGVSRGANLHKVKSAGQ